MQYKLVVISILVCLLMACSKAVDVQLAPTVTAYISGAGEQKLVLTAQDPAYQALNKWLSTHTDGWYSTSGKYPGGVYLVSGEQGIQVTDTKVVLYTRINKSPQATHVYEIDKKTLAEVKRLANR